MTTLAAGSGDPTDAEARSQVRWTTGATALAIALVASLLGLTALLHAERPPGSNEALYVLTAALQWDPDLLPGDWTLGEPWYTHLLFNLTVGWIGALTSLDTLVWIGRIGCWIGSLVLLLRLGRDFALSAPAAAVAIALWLSLGQSVVGGSWIVGLFEAKCLSYMAVLAAVDAFMRDRLRTGAVALGLACAFHVQVGLCAGIGCAVGLLLARRPLPELIRLAAITLVCALPGLIPALLAYGGEPASASDVRFLLLERLPHHIDPMTWPRRMLVVPFLLFAVDMLESVRTLRRGRAEDAAPIRFAMGFEIGAMGLFVLGLGLRAFEAWRPLQALMPFRLAPLFTLLFFLFHGLRAWQSWHAGRPRAVTGALAVLCLLALPNPLGAIVDRVELLRSDWQPEGARVRALHWIRDHTAPGSVVVASPGFEDAWWHSRRPQIVSWFAPTVRHLGEWRARFQALAGDDWQHPRDGMPVRTSLETAFDRRTPAEIESIVERFGGDVLLTRSPYDRPLLHQDGAYRIYALSEPPPEPPR